MKRIFVTTALALIATFGSAWQEQMPPGEKYRPEVTEQELSQQQLNQQTMDEVPVEEQAPKQRTPVESASFDEGDAVANAPTDALQDAEEAIQKKQRPGTGWWWLLGVGILATGGVFAAKHWADRNIPAPPSLP